MLLFLSFSFPINPGFDPFSAILQVHNFRIPNPIFHCKTFGGKKLFWLELFCFHFLLLRSFFVILHSNKLNSSTSTKLPHCVVLCYNFVCPYFVSRTFHYICLAFVHFQVEFSPIFSYDSVHFLNFSCFLANSWIWIFFRNLSSCCYNISLQKQ